MPNLITEKFAHLKKQNKLAFIPYIMAGDSNLQATQEILDLLAKYADAIEIGFPFSDPMADGAIIQKSANRALQNPISFTDVFTLISNFRAKHHNIPVIWMGYYNPIFQYGVANFIEDASQSGINGAIIVDLPSEEQGEWHKIAKNTGFSLIQLISPITPEHRIKQIAKDATGFIYYVMVKGVTGKKDAEVKGIYEQIAKIKQHTTTPIVGGFGIKTPEKIQEIKRHINNLDGVVIGSQLVKILENGVNQQSLSSLNSFLQEIKHSC